MQHLLDVLNSVAQSASYFPKLPKDLQLIEQYLRTGDDKLLPALEAIPNDHLWRLREFAEALPPTTQWSPEDRRAVRFCARRAPALVPQARPSTGYFESGDVLIESAVEKALEHEAASEDAFGAFLAEFSALGIPADRIATFAVGHASPLAREGKLTSAGRFILTLSPKAMARALAELAPEQSPAADFLQPWFSDHSAHAVPVLETLLANGTPDVLREGAWLLFLDGAPAAREQLCARAFHAMKCLYVKFALGRRLVELFPGKYEEALWEIATPALNDESGAECHAATAAWMLEYRAAGALPAISEYLAGWAPANPYRDQWMARTIENLAASAGTNARPVLLAAQLPAIPQTRRAAISALIAFGDPGDDETITSLLAAEFKNEAIDDVLAAIVIAESWKSARLVPQWWELLSHRSKTVRQSAVRELAKQGETAVARASELLKARKADTRAAAATLLGQIGSPAALEALRAALGGEESAAIADTIRAALSAHGDTFAANPGELPPGQSREEIEGAIRKALAKAKVPADWVKPEALPPLYFTDGAPLGADATRYLLFRQSRCKTIEADAEARPLYALIDRASSGEFALAVHSGFIGSGADAGDRWALAIAGLLGDERVVPVLSRQIQEWADSARGKLAEYAVQALAVQASDPALLAVDALATRYRTKYKNIGKAAAEAFSRAAEARGLSPAELGDRVVPWLGFAPGHPRQLAWGDTQLEVSIGLDFKPAYRDLAKNKRLTALPGSAPAEVKAEMKELSASLKEAVKAQLLRLENLMVQQHRWPATRWTELFLQHPLLLPFAVRLVWGGYDDAGKLTRAFRALEDRTLTNAADEPAPAPSEGTVGIVHPLELEPTLRSEWLQHLADYNIAPPFAQLERPVITPAADQAAVKMFDTFDKTELNAMTFRGRAEKRGWVRGSVVDAGCVPFYYKPFPAAGVDVFLYLDGMYVGIDMYSSITLGTFYFVRHGSVQIGSYTYDEPSKETDDRLVPAAQVPPIAYSEALGDLQHIAGKAATTEE